MASRAVLLTGLAALAAPAAARAQLTANDRAALADLGPAYAQRFELRRGWYRGDSVLYFDIGPQPAGTSPIYYLVTALREAGATPVPGQRPIFGSIPGTEGYSAIRQVQWVVVGPDYAANSLRDARDVVRAVLAGRARLASSGLFQNCPIVPEGSVLVDDPDRRVPLVGWYRGVEVACLDFGRTAEEPAPIYTFVTGFDDDAPRFLRAQANVVDIVPGRGPLHRDLWDVTFVEVPEGYQPESVRDAAALVGAGRRTDLVIRRAGQVRNCPVVIVAGRRAERPGLF